jgi:hypothetical protein
LGRKRLTWAEKGSIWANQHHRIYLNRLNSIRGKLARSAENYP